MTSLHRNETPRVFHTRHRGYSCTYFKHKHLFTHTHTIPSQKESPVAQPRARRHQCQGASGVKWRNPGEDKFPAGPRSGGSLPPARPRHITFCTLFLYTRAHTDTRRSRIYNCCARAQEVRQHPSSGRLLRVYFPMHESKRKD